MTRQKNYTRIDIVAVILIIVLLFAVSLPALNLPREMARRVFCAAQLKNIGAANEMYADNYDGWFVPAGYPNTNDSGQTTVIQWIRNNSFRSYLQMDSYNGVEGRYSLNIPVEFLCPSDSVNKYPQNPMIPVYLSYGYNLTGLVTGEWSWVWQNPIGYKREHIANPSAKLMITESVGDWWLDWRGADYSRGWDILGFTSDSVYRSYGVYGAVAYRHSEGLNILFYDSHVQWMRKQDVFIHADWDASPQRPGMWRVE